VLDALLHPVAVLHDLSMKYKTFECHNHRYLPISVCENNFICQLMAVVNNFAKGHSFAFGLAGLSIAQKPLHPVFIYLFWAHVFFAFQLNLGTFCLQFVDVSLNFDTLKLNWVTKIGLFRISGINLSHLGADLSILGAKKTF
jgi:hypothetical protein